MSGYAQTHHVTVTPTLDTSAYSDGDRMGSIMTIEAGNDSGNPVTIMDVKVQDKADQGATFDMLFFNELPVVASADNAAISITDAEGEKYEGHITIDTYSDFGGWQGATKLNVGLAVKPAAADGKIYALLVSRGTPTYAANSLRIKISFAMDRG